MNENFIRGWVRIYRSFDNWEWYTDSNCVHLFLHLLLKANHKPGMWRGMHVERGQLITSLEHLSRETGISIQSIRTVLKKLKLTKELTSRATSRFTVITICNYDSYQDVQNEDNKPPNNELTSEQQTTNKQLTTNKNDNNYKNINNIIYKEILENSEIFFDALGAKCDLKKKNLLEIFAQFFALHYAEDKEEFNAKKVRNHFQNWLPLDLNKTVGKKTNKKGGNTNRPEK